MQADLSDQLAILGQLLKLGQQAFKRLKIAAVLQVVPEKAIINGRCHELVASVDNDFCYRIFYKIRADLWYYFII